MPLGLTSTPTSINIFMFSFGYQFVVAAATYLFFCALFAHVFPRMMHNWPAYVTAGTVMAFVNGAMTVLQREYLWNPDAAAVYLALDTLLVEVPLLLATLYLTARAEYLELSNVYVGREHDLKAVVTQASMYLMELWLVIYLMYTWCQILAFFFVESTTRSDRVLLAAVWPYTILPFHWTCRMLAKKCDRLSAALREVRHACEQNSNLVATAMGLGTINVEDISVSGSEHGQLKIDLSKMQEMAHRARTSSPTPVEIPDDLKDQFEKYKEATRSSMAPKRPRRRKSLAAEAGMAEAAAEASKRLSLSTNNPTDTAAIAAGTSDIEVGQVQSPVASESVLPPFDMIRFPSFSDASEMPATPVILARVINARMATHSADKALRQTIRTLRKRRSRVPAAVSHCVVDTAFTRRVLLQNTIHNGGLGDICDRNYVQVLHRVPPCRGTNISEVAIRVRRYI
eukprot:GFYU01002524.1.p1 GENE.GFYU01002524.1~~GFYU01002524.1.p1  ORF type:complete len:456 (+),score=41.00 GFYU01002524.1:428-1795(+)